MPNQNGQGRGKNQVTNKCTCPKCGNQVDHQRGTPCSQSKCENCQTTMQGDNCKE